MKIKTLKNDKIEPSEEIMFHFVKKSGKSEYRRGIPANPRKCWGKKVRLTPMNIEKKWIFNKIELKDHPKNIGNQWVIPARMAKTAPIDKT